MRQFQFYTGKINTDSHSFTYGSIMESKLIEYLKEYIELFGINVKEIEHIYLFISHQTPFLSDKCRHFKSAFVNLWYCSRVEHCGNVLIQLESDGLVESS